MKLVVKILVVCFLIAVVVELVTRDSYVIYDCRVLEEYKNYPTSIVQACLKHRSGTII